MLEWLKVILGEAYSEEIDKKISDEIGKGFVARADFNAANDAKKQLEKDVAERDKQIGELKKIDPAELQATIERLQQENKANADAFKEQLKQAKIDAAIDTALVSAKAKNAKAVKALLDLEKTELLEDGTVKGLDEQIKQLTESDDSSFLFNTEKKQGQFKGLKPGESFKAETGDAELSKMGYDELVSYLAQNPEAKLE